MSTFLSNKPVLYMLIMFMDTAVGWVLGVSLSEQQICAIYIFLDIVHSPCSQVGP
jgi:hypothetical protein